MPIRRRLGLLFALLAALAFATGGYFFSNGLSSRLLGLLDAQLAAQLDQVSRNIVPTVGPREPSGTSRPTSGPVAGEYFFQVLDRGGHVQGSSRDAGAAPLLHTTELLRAERGQVFLSKRVEGEHARLAAAPDPGHQGWVEIAGASLESLDSALREVTVELLVAGVIAVLVAGAGAYWLARAALSPVERMRQEVAALSEQDSEATIEVPDTKDEIAALASTMNAILLRLQRALSRQRAFVADAGHELRTPFAVMQAELELAAKPGRSYDELIDAIHHTAEEAARLSRLSDDLLLLARSDEGQLALRIDETPLAPLLNRSAVRAGAPGEEVGVPCRIDAASDLKGRIDPDRIRQAVDNLVDNARRFAPADTEVVVRAKAEGADLVISVVDCGPGFPEGFLPHVFERFRRPDPGRTRRGGGAGLGLAIVHAIVVAHGGTALARNRSEGGAEITLRFPGAALRRPSSDGSNHDGQ